MNKTNFFVLFSQLSISALLFIVDIHNILSDMLILRSSDVTYFQGLRAVPSETGSEGIMLLPEQVRVLEQGYAVSFKIGKTIEALPTCLLYK